MKNVRERTCICVHQHITIALCVIVFAFYSLTSIRTSQLNWVIVTNQKQRLHRKFILISLHSPLCRVQCICNVVEILTWSYETYSDGRKFGSTIHFFCFFLYNLSIFGGSENIIWKNEENCMVAPNIQSALYIIHNNFTYLFQSTKKFINFHN